MGFLVPLAVASLSATFGIMAGAGSGGALAEMQEAAPARPTQSSGQVGAATAERSPPRDAARPSSATVIATPAMLDLGFMRPNQNAVGTVTLRNTGTVPAKVIAVTPSCKCTTTSNVAGMEIAPGATLSFDATLEGAPVPGVRTSNIRIAIEGMQSPIEVKVKGEVSQPVRAVPAYLNCVGGKNLSGRMVVESIDKRPFTILSANGSAPSIGGWDPAKDSPRSTYLLSYDLGDGSGDLPPFWIVETDHPDAPLVDLKVRHESVSSKLALRLSDYRASAGRIDPGATGSVTFTSMDPQEPIINVESLTPDATLKLEGADAVPGGTQARISLTPKAGHAGLLLVPARLATPSKSQEVLIFATVRPAPPPGVPASPSAGNSAP